MLRTHIKKHLLKCAQVYKNTQAELQLTAALRENQWQCAWANCSKGEFNSAASAAAHVSEHLSADCLRCEWNSCSYISEDLKGL
jgi:hypothetical protein